MFPCPPFLHEAQILTYSFQGGMPPFSGTILLITVRSRDTVLMELIGIWAGLKGDLTNYRLNSSLLMKRFVSF